ncbi:ABC transporter ATP-binding protein [Halarchaeum nitratireducens]|uniref:Molybdate/tungstate import ATP-binding protein WtpC n=1 Tax=Halarchaeum nitratireducens TaxID=489913 RepID=A0A830G9N6_9EURY|nr:ABC transporter ATP-binding protein [Halarchaeum nitratireducens]GGN10955.1 ABC transporter [Halarchaeum nitratireducens]
MTGIVLEGVDKWYNDDVHAVDGVSLVVEDGEFVTLVGPSGCGKTTTLRTIAGFESPTSGTVGIDGRDVTDVAPDDRNAGMVFQDFALFPHMTIAENVAYGLRVQDGHEDVDVDARVEEMLDLVELPGTADRTPEQLSGGQQQRVALARALAPRPDVLLLDEPLASLDKKLRETMQVEIKRIQQETDITTLLVTHNQTEALTMSDRIAVMNDGHLAQVGPPEEIYNDPNSRFVADFIGTANVLEGTVTRLDDGVATVDCGDHALRATADEVAGPGDDVSVVVRPERTALDATAADGGADPDVNAFEGRIELRQFMGDRVEYHVDTGERTLISVRDAESPGLDVGDPVVASAPVDDCLLVGTTDD